MRTQFLLACLLVLTALASCSSGRSTTDGIKSLDSSTTPNIAARPESNEETGLEELLFAALKRLGRDASSTSPRGPQHEANTVFDLRIAPATGEGTELSWTEQLAGDYDQNGLVNLADLTWLSHRDRYLVTYDEPAPANRFVRQPSGKVESYGAVNWRLSRVDGNSDGIINLYDITPLAIHWQASLSGYRVYRRAPGETEYSRLAGTDETPAGLTVPRPVINPHNPVRYKFTDTTATQPGMYSYFVAPYDIVSRVEGPAGNTMFLDIDRWESGQVIAIPANPEEPDRPTGHEASAAIIDDHPAVAFVDKSMRDLRYMRALNENGTAWAEPVVIDNSSAQDTLQFLVVNGNPAVAYYYAKDRSLRFARALDAHGSVWTAPVTAVNPEPKDDGSSPDAVGWYCRMTVVEGRPALCYYDDKLESIRYVRALDADGASWGQPIDVLPDNTEVYPMEMDILGGRPTIFYGKSLSYEGIFLVNALDPEGSSWDGPQHIQATERATSVSVAFVDGNPAIAYFASQLTWYQRALDAQGENWDDPMLVYDGIGYGTSPSLAVISGRPAISYYRSRYQVDGKLMFTRCMDSTGSSWTMPAIIDDGQDRGRQNCLLPLGSDGALVTYLDSETGNLMYIRMN